MFEHLKSFIHRVAAGEKPHAFADGDYRLAAAALLVHVADIDGITTESERARLRSGLSIRFSLDDASVTRLLDEAQERDREAVDVFQFTSVLQRTLDHDGRMKVVEMMWEIAFADGIIHEFEEDIVGRVAELLGIDADDRIRLRQKVTGDRETGAGPPK